jgi:serine phosphatase RsbU (regulator of sigma subunit)
MITTPRILLEVPGYGIAFYALIPIVLSGFWFGHRGAVLTSATAALVYLLSEFIWPSQTLQGAGLWVAAVNRSVIYVGVAVITATLLEHERRLRSRVAQQQQRLTELESLCTALTPAEIPPRPGLELATAFFPAERPVAGDFFLVVPGPADDTTIVVGDVVGHGLEAARQASYVRATLATFAAFTSDPVRLLQLTNTALVEQIGNRVKFATAICVNIRADRQLRWACAGHCPPWQLDNGQPLEGGKHGPPLGISTELDLSAGSCVLPAGGGIVLFTDGLPEARPAHRHPSVSLELYGEQRLHKILTALPKASPDTIANALGTAIKNFTGGALADDVCLVVCRATTQNPTLTNKIIADQQRSVAAVGEQQHPPITGPIQTGDSLTFGNPVGQTHHAPAGNAVKSSWTCVIKGSLHPWRFQSDTQRTRLERLGDPGGTN